MSSKAASTPSSAPATSSERMPGVSIEQRAAGQLEQLAVGRRVAAARVVVADGGRGLARLAEEGVDERRLADARRPEHDRGPARSPGAAAGRSRWSPVSAESTTTGTPGRDRLDGDEAAVEVVGDVRLVEHDDRGDAARPGDREVALEAAQVEVVVEAGDDEGHVDVGGDDLLVGEVAGRPPARVGGAARERRPARQDRRDDRLVLGARGGGGRLERDPVADGRVVRRGERVEAEPAGHGRRPVQAVRPADDRGLLVDGDDARRATRPASANGARCVSQAGSAEPMHQPTRFSLPVRFA